MGRNLDIGDRLRSERERLGMSQTEFAERADVTRKTLFGYESGERSPSADALAAWAAIGLDVLYVVTGSRSFSPGPAVTSEQRALIADYDVCSPSDQAALRRTAAAMALGASAKAETKKPVRTAKQLFTGKVAQVITGNVTNKAPITFNVGGKKK
ncbi:helix-turn-helix domain-containing protein [Achromobacter sp. 413638]|uniref:helix-turn-helix domain-containing protein n=1 Tax=Achromobacter sp. 413638 TaxID=3342385 RepID=UPI00370A165D